MNTSIIPEIGGGNAYSRIVTEDEADAIVTTADGLETTVNNANSGETIFVPGDAIINLSGRLNIGPPDSTSNVTIASDRGHNGSPGALLYDDTFTTHYPDALFLSECDGWRMSGLRIRGPEGRNIDNDSSKQSRPIWTRGIGTEVDNCELFHWTVAGHTHGGFSFPESTVHCHHNFFHDCAMDGLGYGFDHFNGHALVEFNYFNGHRHAITCAGQADASYVARYNFIDLLMYGFPIDMHPGDTSAGEFLHVHHNTIMGLIDQRNGDVEEFLKVRGVPAQQSSCYNNWSRHGHPTQGDVSQQNAGNPIVQETVDTFTNLDVHDNHYEEFDPSQYAVGCPRVVSCEHLVPNVYDSNRDPFTITNRT